MLASIYSQIAFIYLSILSLQHNTMSLSLSNSIKCIYSLLPSSLYNNIQVVIIKIYLSTINLIIKFVHIYGICVCVVY